MALGGLLAILGQSTAWLGRTLRTTPRVPNVLTRALGTTPAARWSAPTFIKADSKRTAAFMKCIEEYNPDDPSNEEFNAGPPPTGFRQLTEALRPFFDKQVDWMLWPNEVGSFERDQKVASTYALATGLFQDINQCIREDNEDGMRRLAPMIWEIRELLRFETAKICKPGGRKVKPFTGKALRGWLLPVDVIEEVQSQYKIGEEFIWPAFTSCQHEDENTPNGGLWPFNGNMNFEIDCNIDPATMKAKEVLAPVRIGRLLTHSHEVLLPPFTKFRVTGEKKVESVKDGEEGYKNVYCKLLEVVELPTPQAGKPGERRR